jgi:hypothetical protein
MTPEQDRLVIEAAQLGLACGLTHPEEWYVNATSHAPSYMHYAEAEVYESLLREAFVAFLQGTASCPGDPMETLTVQNFEGYITDWYASMRA